MQALQQGCDVVDGGHEAAEGVGEGGVGEEEGVGQVGEEAFVRDC